MPYVKRTQSSGRGAYQTRRVRRRRRTSVVAKTYRSRGARAQASQIRSVARMAIRNARFMNSQKQYLDYELQGLTSGDWVSGTWSVWSLIDPISWKPTMRQNTAGDSGQSAFVRSMFLQYTVALRNLLRSTAVTVYLVTMRSGANDFTPSSSTMINGQHYDNCGQAAMPRLNPNVFKVKYAKTFNLLTNAFNAVSLTASATDVAGDPETSYRRITQSIKLGMNLRSRAVRVPPATESSPWSTMTDEAILPSQRMYLMMYQNSGDQANAPGAFWHALFNVVTMN